MIKTTDALIHLPRVNAGPWTQFMDRYERRVRFRCDYHKLHFSTLKVYTNDEGARIVAVKIDGVTHAMTVGENVDPFSTAHETLLALSRDCGCDND